MKEMIEVRGNECLYDIKNEMKGSMLGQRTCFERRFYNNIEVE